MRMHTMDFRLLMSCDGDTKRVYGVQTHYGEVWTETKEALVKKLQFIFGKNVVVRFPESRLQNPAEKRMP